MTRATKEGAKAHRIFAAARALDHANMLLVQSVMQCAMKMRFPAAMTLNGIDFQPIEQALEELKKELS